MANEKRLIDANAIKYRTIGCGGWGQPEEVADKYNIDRMPTVDAVEVVRCKDCLYWEEYDGEMFCNCYSNLMTDTAPDDFCSYGERREGE